MNKNQIHSGLTQIEIGELFDSGKSYLQAQFEILYRMVQGTITTKPSSLSEELTALLVWLREFNLPSQLSGKLTKQISEIQGLLQASTNFKEIVFGSQFLHQLELIRGLLGNQNEELD